VDSPFLPSLEPPSSESRTPPGFEYLPEFLTREEEADLLAIVRELPLAPSRYREFTAKRRIISYGGRYDFTHRELHDAPPVPPFLHPVRARAARWAGLDPEHLMYALITEYVPGAPIGWHRDAPQYGVTMGLSLLGRARMRLRPYRPTAGAVATRRTRADIVSVELAPRSAYVIRDDARWRWQHSIPPVAEPRYSITFRTPHDVAP